MALALLRIIMQYKPMPHPTPAALPPELSSIPVDDEPTTQADLDAIAEAEADVAAGRVYTTAELFRELALSDAAEQRGEDGR